MEAIDNFQSSMPLNLAESELYQKSIEDLKAFQDEYTKGVHISMPGKVAQ